MNIACAVSPREKTLSPSLYNLGFSLTKIASMSSGLTEANIGILQISSSVSRKNFSFFIADLEIIYAVFLRYPPP